MGAYTDITVTKVSDLSLEPPIILCPKRANFSLAVTILELTASQISPAIPTPSLLVVLSSPTGKEQPGCKKVYSSAYQISLPNHFVSWIAPTDTRYRFNSLNSKSNLSSIALGFDKVFFYKYAHLLHSPPEISHSMLQSICTSLSTCFASYWRLVIISCNKIYSTSICKFELS